MSDPVGNSIPLSGNALIDGLIQGGSWQSSPGVVTHALTYSLNINDNGSTPPSPDPLGGTWDQSWIAAAAAAFTAWANVANITFQQQPLNNGQYYFQSTADLALTRTGDDLLSGSGGTIVALGIFPDPNFVPTLGISRVQYPKPEGDIAFDNTYAGYQYLAPGGWGFHTFVHEIGHSLGLKHPGDDGANGRPTFTELGIGTMDTPLWTVMNENPAMPAAIGFAATPMPLDILAIQHIYGANMSFHTGDDTYALTDYGIVQTIWDAGGNDTIDASGLAFGIALDLRPGTFTYHGAFSVTAIAYNVNIENAIGTAFNDTITGNAAGNALNGGSGNDTLNGGDGDDALFYSSGNDTLNGDAGRDVGMFLFPRASASAISPTSVTGPSGTASLNSVEVKAFLDVNHGGTFVAGQAYYKDINGDGRIDLTLQNDSHQFWLSTASGSGLSAPYLAFQHGGPIGFIRDQTQFADINGDSYQDAVFQGLDNQFWANYGSPGGYTGPQLVAHHGGPFSPEQVQYADVTGDGADDLIFQGVDNRFWLSRSNGSGFDDPILCATHGGPFSPESVQYGDISGDGRADLIFQGVDNRFWISTSDGNAFGAPYFANSHGGDFNPAKVQYADVNGDDRVDLLYQGDDNRFWLSTSDGVKFGTPQLVAVVTHDDFNTDQVHYVDMNGDGRADMMYQGDGNGFWYYESTGVGFAPGQKVMDAPGTFLEGSAGYGDIDGNGSAEIIYQDPSNDFYVTLDTDWFI